MLTELSVTAWEKLRSRSVKTCAGLVPLICLFQFFYIDFTHLLKYPVEKAKGNARKYDEF